MSNHLSLKLIQRIQHVLDEYKPKSMLDIGCASGRHSVTIAEYCNVEYLGLMDGDGSGEIFHDYRDGELAWNDVNEAKRLAEETLTCRIEAFVQNTKLTIPVDMITSFKSWGTHYPIATYIPLAVRSLNPGGVIIVDMRPGDEEFRKAQADEMRAAGFELVGRLGRDAEMRKHVFTRN